MSDRELVHQLGELKTVKTAPALWRAGARERLLAQVDSQPSTRYTAAESMRLWVMQLRLHVAPVSFVPVVASAALVFVLAVPFVSAMNASLPGNPLYSFKRSLEQVELSFHTSAEGQGVAYLTLAQHRLTELARLPQNSPYQAQVLRDYNIALGFAQAGLNAAPLSSRLGVQYNDALAILGNELRAVAVTAPAAPAYHAALGLTDRLSGESLALLVAAHQSGQNGMLPQELSQRLEQQIAKVEAKLAGVDGKISQFPSSQPAPRVIIESKQTIVAAREAGQLAKESLSQAKALVAKNDFTLALQKMEESEDITAKTEAAVDKEAAAGEVKGASTAVPAAPAPADGSTVAPEPTPAPSTPSPSQTSSGSLGGQAPAPSTAPAAEPTTTPPAPTK